MKENINVEISKTNQNEVNKGESICVDDYNCAKSSVRKKLSILLVCLLIIELTATGLFFSTVNQKNIQHRIFNELEMRMLKEITMETGTYTGETDFGYFSGDGTFEFKSGVVYSGTWKNNMLNGKGIIKIPAEGEYDGDFLNSQKEGEGTFKWLDGSVYTGEWKADKMNGRGKYTSFDNVVYDGSFKDNLFESGICTFSNETGDYTLKFKDCGIDNCEVLFTDKTTYVGTCNLESITGSGIMKFSNKDEYNGNFSNNMREGKGTYTWKSGDKYDGDWSADKMNGEGNYTFKNGSEISGTFKDNKFINGNYKVKNDFGDYDFKIENSTPVEVDMKLKDGTSYSGPVKNGKLSGQANIKYSNGDKYSGDVSDGKKSGQGKYIWKNGASYDGEWKADKMDGRGTYMYPSKSDGYKLTGQFKNGNPNGKCDYYTSANNNYETDWSDGRCVKIYE